MSSMDDITRARKFQQVNANERFKDRSRENLMKVAEKKFKTTFIYALAEFETVFGPELFGTGLDEDELDCVQKENRKRWQQVRTNILNKGHAQARGLINEMMLYDIQFTGYRYGMAMEEKNDNGSK